jgi:hypothetical protein
MTALVLVASMLTGCAEFDKRGGIVAEVEDYVLFTAHTKSHRLFRSYMLIGVLMAAARQGGHNQADRAAIEGSLKETLSVAFEAYACLYQNRGDAREDRQNRTLTEWMTQVASDAPASATFKTIAFAEPANCQFFDEKMARLDYALYRLALSALFNEKTNAKLATIRDKLVGELPVLSASAKAAIFTVKAANEATNIVDDLLNLSFSSLGPTLILLPLYRDALELNMWVILDSLNKACNLNVSTDAARLFNADGTPALTNMEPCEKRDYVYYVLSRGGGSLPLWRNFVRNMNYTNPYVEAYAPHFMLVSRFIWRSCTNYLTETECGALMTKASVYATKQSIQINLSHPNERFDRIDSAAAPRATRVAQPPSKPSESPPQSSSSPAARDPDPTGSIAKPEKPTQPTTQ